MLTIVTSRMSAGMTNPSGREHHGKECEEREGRGRVVGGGAARTLRPASKSPDSDDLWRVRPPDGQLVGGGRSHRIDVRAWFRGAGGAFGRFPDEEGRPPRGADTGAHSWLRPHRRRLG